MEQQQRPPPEMMNDEGMNVMEDETSTGREPSRFRQMMEQSERKGMVPGRGQRPPGLEWMRGPPGLQQKLAIPLDDDDEDESENKE